ncbi:hypothetical protein VTK56DRAFT_9283 [Thermocarpiscus australiensis]
MSFVMSHHGSEESRHAPRPEREPIDCLESANRGIGFHVVGVLQALHIVSCTVYAAVLARNSISWSHTPVAMCLETCQVRISGYSLQSVQRWSRTQFARCLCGPYLVLLSSPAGHGPIGFFDGAGRAGDRKGCFDVVRGGTSSFVLLPDAAQEGQCDSSGSSHVSPLLYKCLEATTTYPSTASRKASSLSFAAVLSAARPSQRPLQT